jgi:hypothetical protein
MRSAALVKLVLIVSLVSVLVGCTSIVEPMVMEQSIDCSM